MRTMRSQVLVGTVTSLVAGALLLAAAPAANAAEDVQKVKRGNCSMSNTWKLELEKEHGTIEVDFNAYTKQAGKTWKYKVKQNDVVRAKGSTVSERDGDVEVDKKLTDRKGLDKIVVRVKNPASGEVCRAELSI